MSTRQSLSARLLALSAIGSLLAAFAPGAALGAPRAEVLADPSLPGYSAALVKSLAATLRGAGYAPALVTVKTVLAPGALDPKKCALFAIPQGRKLPGVLATPIQNYVTQGGHLLALGAPLWSAPLVKDTRGKWVTEDEFQQSLALIPAPHPLATNDLSGWKRTSNNESSPATMFPERAAAMGRNALAAHMVISNLTGWDTWLSPPLSGAFPAGDTLTVFSAKGGPNTHAIAVEWDDSNGTRWIATVPVSTQWRRYALPPSDFIPWEVPAALKKAGFQTATASRISFGMAFSHTGSTPGRQEFWLADIGTGPSDMPAQGVSVQANIPALEILSPDYKFFPMHGAVKLAGMLGTDHLASSARSSLRSQGSPSLIRNPPGPLLQRRSRSGLLFSPPFAKGGLGGFPPASGEPQRSGQASLLSVQPRPNGAGFDKGRGWRQIALLTATDPRSGQWRGLPGALRVQAPSAGDAGEAWASFTFTDPAVYATAPMRALIAQTVRRMRDGLFLIDGGAEFYTLFPKQSVRLGAQVANIAPVGEDSARRATVRVSVATPNGHVVWRKEWPLVVKQGQNIAREARWTPPARNPAGGYLVTAEMLEGGNAVDRVQHALNIYAPPAHPDFIATKGGHFSLDGKLWRAFGVNYMPSSGIGVEDSSFFEQWMSARAYDPAIINRDLAHIQDMGMNSVSAFLYAGATPAQNLLDFLRLAKAHHLHVNLGLRPTLDNYLDLPEAEGLAKIAEGHRQIIDYYHLAGDDTVFAYDIDWEPSFGNQDIRRRMDPDWRAWVAAHYGSAEKAEAAWGIAAPRDSDGALTNPSDSQVSSASGPATKLVADYRAFLDQWLAATYGAARDTLRKLDPNHLVSFRMSEAGDPTNDDSSSLPYQFVGLASAVDFLSPEAYGRIGDWQKVRPGLFEIAYARAVAPKLPVVWAEVGVSVANRSANSPTQATLARQGQFYSDFIKMATEGGADGILFWWYPGGYRYGEDSDFGLINPDGTDRPATAAIRRAGLGFLNAPLPSTPNTWLEFDRAKHPNGIFGIYSALGAKFFDAIDQGKTPGLRAAKDAP